jgi:hypothetical protein
MKDFIEAIKPYIEEVIVNPDNEAIVKYKLTKVKTTSYNRGIFVDGVRQKRPYKAVAKPGPKGTAINTPQGKFPSLKIAAAALGVDLSYLSYRLARNKDGFSYVVEEEDGEL